MNTTTSKAVPNLFRITSTVIFIQLFLGGLLTFDFINPDFHIITGLLVFILAVSTMIVTFATKSSLGALRGISAGMVALIIIQIALGFEVLQSSSSILALIHFGVALGIYAMSVAGSIMAFMWANIARNRTTLQAQEIK